MRSDPADLAQKVSIAIKAGEDFTREKRNLARLREIDFDFIGEEGDLLKYREVARGNRARAAASTFFLVPRQQVPGRAVYFLCEQRCTAYVDFSKTVTLEIRFAQERLGDWATIDRKVRGLVDSFTRP
ncbi:MAG: hypothetical protein EXQ89_05085 [Rhodospirillaceae bacterium]|nr:hypothetical protein [Rhodospirillaceae bacterium]